MLFLAVFLFLRAREHNRTPGLDTHTAGKGIPRKTDRLAVGCRCLDRKKAVDYTAVDCMVDNRNRKADEVVDCTSRFAKVVGFRLRYKFVPALAG